MTTQTTPEPPEVTLARDRHWVLTRRELLDLGLTPAAIRHRVRTGRLHPIHRGVYAVGRPHLTREGRWRAAVLACGEEAALSHTAAGAFWSIIERGDERPHVVVPASGGRHQQPGMTVHRSQTLAPSDVLIRNAVPVTTLQRTLIDLARVSTREQLKAAARRAEIVHRIDLAALHDRAAAHPTDVGCGRLARLLVRYVPAGLAESELEACFLELCDRYRLPRPDQQRRLAGAKRDFAWLDAALTVEVDGRATHDTDIAFLDDRVRDRALKATGVEVLRFTWSEVVHDAATVAREIREALRRGAGSR